MVIINKRKQDLKQMPILNGMSQCYDFYLSTVRPRAFSNNPKRFSVKVKDRNLNIKPSFIFLDGTNGYHIAIFNNMQ